MRRMAAALTLLLAAAGLAADGGLRAAQAPQAATGLIFGRVIEATSGAPVRGAIVRIFGAQGDSGLADPTVMTDGEGHFVFSSVPAGSFRIFASKFGHSDGAFGRRRPNPDADADALVLAAGERRGDVTIRIWKHAAITGMVMDEFGEPAVGVVVRAFPRVFIAGRPRLGANGYTQSRTDDRGVYRLPRLVAGDYIVALMRTESAAPATIVGQLDQAQRGGDRDAMMAMFEELQRAGIGMLWPGDSRSLRVGTSVYQLQSPPLTPRGDRVWVYPPQYYGGTSQVSTTRAIALRSGQEVAGIDFAMKPVPAFRVSGQVTDANGPVPSLPIKLTTPGTGDFEIDRLGPASTTVTDTAGRFTLLGVTPGNHVLRALKGPGGEVGIAFAAMSSSGEAGAVISTSREVFASEPAPPRSPTLYVNGSVGVSDADVDDLSLVVRTGVRFSGRVEFSGARDQPDAATLKRIRVVVEARDGGMPDWEFEMTGKVTADKLFETVELPPGSYFVRVPDPPVGWTLESVTSGGRDLSDVPIDLTDRAVSAIVIRFTDRSSALSGTVRVEARDDRVDEALVLVFPTDRTRWMDYGARPRRLQQSGLSKDGAFTMTGLPPGEYFVAAIRDDFLTDWRDPAFLDKVSQLATRVGIGAGEQKSQSLVMGRVR